MFKNVASQKVRFYAFIPSTGLPKTGDAANLTAYVSKDWGSLTALTDTSATEVDSTNAKGVYTFDVSQSETNADTLDFTCKSSTADVAIVPIVNLQTSPNRFGTLVIDSAGLADATTVKVGPTGAGTAQTARDLGASVLISSGTGTGQLSVTSGVIASNVTQWLGTAAATPTTAGVPEVDVTFWTGVATVAGAIPAVAAGASGGLPTGDATNSVKVQARLKKNQALANFRFVMTDSTTDNPATGKTVTVTRGIDGSAHSAGTLSAVSEIGNGEYRCDFAAADLNGNIVSFRATASGCNDLIVDFFMEP